MSGALQKLQVTIAGFSGQACTVAGSYNPASQILTIVKIAPYRRERAPGCLVVTNVRDIERDEYFPAEKLPEAVSAYFEVASGVSSDGRDSRLQVLTAAANANPAGAVQIKQLDESGPKYELLRELRNEQVAVMVACWHVVRADVIEDSIGWLEDLADYQESRVSDRPVYFI